MFRRDRSHSRGQTLVEFTLVVPILVVLIGGFFDLGRVVLAHDALSHAAREAARYAIVHGGSIQNRCPVGPLAPEWTAAPAATASCPNPSPSRESIYQVARQQAAAANVTATVQACYGEGCTGGTDIAGATNRRGTPMTVTVHATVNMAVLSIIGLGPFDVTSTSTMLVNH